MDKNMFFIFNDIVYHLYACRTLEELKNDFLVPLKIAGYPTAVPVFC